MNPRFRAVNTDCNFDYSLERTRLEPLGVEYVTSKCSGEDEIIAACSGADAVVLEGTTTPITARVIAALPRCRLIAKYAVGVDNIDVPAATAAGIVVANAADYCTEEVADHAAALILGSARGIVALDRHVRAGRWQGFTRIQPMRRVSHLTLGLVGFGRISRLTAQRMAGFGMQILASDPFLAAGKSDFGVEIVPLERLLREADFVSVHVPLAPETRGLLGEASFRLMKPTAVVINTSRGPVIDEAALVKALQEKWIAGAALDVFEKEPLPLESPLRAMDQVILTPHQGANSTDALDHVHRTVTESLAAFSQGFWPPFPINPKVAPRMALRPYNEFRG
jgi:D-3-phosphoglycerate dehydrogenase